MAGVGGFFLQGLGEGLQTGFQMGQQTKEWNWQKKEKERIQKEKDDVMEAASAFNKKIESYYADGTLSDDEKLQLNTMYMASGYNIQEIIKGSYDAVMKLDKDTEEHNLTWLKSYRESLGNLDPSSIPELYEYTKGQMIGEKGKAMFEAGDRLLKKQHEALQKQKPIVFTSPEELLKVYPDSSWTHTTEGYIPTYQEPTKPKEVGISDYNSAANYLKNFSKTTTSIEAFNKIKAGLQSKFPEIDMSSITQESLREPEKPTGTGTELETVSTLKNWEDMFNIKSETGPKTEEEYNRVLELLARSKDNYKPKYPSWKEALISEVKLMSQELKDLAQDKSTIGKNNFKRSLNIYMQKLEEIKTKYPEVNLSQFSTFEEEKGWFQKLLEKVGL